MGELSDGFRRKLLEGIVAERHQYLVVMFDPRDRLIDQVRVYFEMYDGKAQVKTSWLSDRACDIAIVELWDPAEVHLVERLDRRDHPYALAPGDSMVINFDLNID